MAELNPGKLSFRSGSSNDASTVHDLIKPYVDRALLLDRTVQEIAALAEHSVAADYEGKLIGFAAVEVYSRKLAEIQCLAVREGYQQLGVGKQLVARCIEIAREKKVAELMAISSSSEFLQACGFDYSLPGQKRALFVNP
jgi:amino-acid N-acetyltransferase